MQRRPDLSGDLCRQRCCHVTHDGDLARLREDRVTILAKVTSIDDSMQTVASSSEILSNTTLIRAREGTGSENSVAMSVPVPAILLKATCRTRSKYSDASFRSEANYAAHWGGLTLERGVRHHRAQNGMSSSSSTASFLVPTGLRPAVASCLFSSASGAGAVRTVETGADSRIF